MADGFRPQRIRAAYDTVAAQYDATYGNELDELPIDADLIDQLAAGAGDGLILEAGAGVAPVARRLRSATVIASDLSAAMLSFAPPATPRAQADITALPFRTGTFAAAVVRYVLQHLERGRVPHALAELRRVLTDDGHLLVAVHLGEGHVEFDELLGQRFETIAGAFHRRDELLALLAAAGFSVVSTHERGPVANEANTRRLSVVARVATPGNTDHPGDQSPRTPLG